MKYNQKWCPLRDKLTPLILLTAAEGGSGSVSLCLMPYQELNTSMTTHTRLSTTSPMNIPAIILPAVTSLNIEGVG